MIQRIPKCYVSGNYVQVRIPFDKYITLISSDFINDGILCHYDFNSNSQNVNKYLDDERRKGLPYANVPMYKEARIELFVDVQYVKYINQILEFNKHYISITPDFCISDIYAVKDGEEALVFCNILYIPQGLEEIGVKKKELLDEYEMRVIACINRDGENINFKKSFRKFFSSGGGLIILNDGGDITFRMIELITKGPYYFKREYDIPFNDYRLEELKGFGTRIKNMKKPKIYRIFNPNIDRKDIIDSKKLVRKLNK